MFAALEAGVTGCSGSAARMQSRRSRMAPTRSRASTRSSVRAMPTSPRRRHWSPPTARSTSSPARARSRSSSSNGVAEWIAADLIAQAEHDPDARADPLHAVARLARESAREIVGQLPADGPARSVARRATAASWSRARRTRRSRSASGWRRSSGLRQRRRRRAADARRHRVRRRARARRRAATTSPARTTCCRPAAPRRARGGLSAADFVRVSSVQRIDRRGLAASAPPAVALAEAEGLPAMPSRVRIAVDRDGAATARSQQDLRGRPDDLDAGGRPAPPPQREHRRLLAATCSRAPRADATGRRLLPGLRRGHRRDARASRHRRRQRRAHQRPGRGILAGIAGRRCAARRPTIPFEAIIVRARRSTCTPRAPRPLGARIIDVPPVPDFAFPLRAVLAAITPRTRLIFLTNPNNPTGLSIPRSTISRTIAAAAPQALVFLDEAYADFAGQTMIEDAASRAYRTSWSAERSPRRTGWPDCASARWSAPPATLAPMRRRRAAVHPERLRRGGAARRDRRTASTASGISSRSRESKRAALRRAATAGRPLLAERRPTSCSCVGDDARASWRGLAARGIHVRDRSRDPGCAGCIADHGRRRRSHAPRCIAALEEVLCAARVIDRQDDRDADRADADARRQGPVRGPHRHPVLRSHAGAVRPSRRRST